jgi:hypothetical protein
MQRQSVGLLANSRHFPRDPHIIAYGDRHSAAQLFSQLVEGAVEEEFSVPPGQVLVDDED